MKLAHKVRVIQPEHILLGVLVAFVWANLSQESYHHVVDYPIATIPWLGDEPVNLHFIANEVLMALFFWLAGKEVFEAIALPGGDLHGARKAALPLLSTLGGVVGPAIAFLALTHFFAPEASGGWVIPTATDIAFALLVAKYLFGFKHPAITFITTIAVVDDGIGLALIAAVYSDGVNVALLIAAPLVAVAVTYFLRAVGVKKWQVYFVVVGVPLWVAFAMLGVEPAMALIPLVFAMPHANNDLGMWNPRELESHDALNEMEHAIKPWIGCVLVLFGFANGGIAVGSVGTLTIVVLVSLVVGKLVGITLFTYAGVACGLKLPEGMKLRDIPVLGAIAGIGFTVAIFVTGVAFEGEMAELAKMGAALSLIVGGMLAYGLHFVFRRNAVKPNLTITPH